MGETSYKSMRASAMDDVIFAGTDRRPARNMAEVMVAIDNSKRTAPAAFNDADVLEISRRIQREAGSIYKVNGKEVRAKDVQILFADAATGRKKPGARPARADRAAHQRKAAGAPPHPGGRGRHRGALQPPS